MKNGIWLSISVLIKFEKIFWLILICLFVPVIANNLCYGQPDNIRFKHLSSNSGLTSSRINCFAQDQQGFIWVGTIDGLNKYDGYSFETFYSNLSDSLSLYSNQIYSLYLDHEGTLWIGTSNGVNIYDKYSNTFVRKSNIPHHYIYNITGYGKDKIIIASEELYVYDKKTDKTTRYIPDENDPNSISPGIINKIYIDSRNNIWLATQNGLNLFNIKKGTFRKFIANPKKDNSLTGNDIRAIAEDKNKNLWVGTTEGLTLMTIKSNNLDSIQFTKFLHDPTEPLSLTTPYILSLHSDKLNNLWIGTQNGGLDILPLNDKKDFSKIFFHYKQQVNSIYSLNNNSVQCIFEDNNGNIWLGTYAGGINLYYLNGQPFKHFSNIPCSNSSINDNQVNTFLEEKNYLWIGTEGGLNLYDKRTKSFRYYTYKPDNPNSIGANAVWSVITDHSGNLWVGTWEGGLNKFEYPKGIFTKFKHNPSDSTSIGSNNIRPVFFDREGNLWIGTMGGGLSHYNPQTRKFTNYNISNSDIKTNYVISIVEYSDSILLLPNILGVVAFNKFDHSFKPYKFDEFKGINLEKLFIYTVYIDHLDNLWFGTEFGLLVINKKNGKSRHYTSTDGLPNSSIKSILEDDKGNLWVGTNGGLIKLINAAEIPQKPIFKRYTYEDGLQGNEFNPRSCYKSLDGTLYFGGNNGFNVFHPDSIKDNPQKINIVITDFILYNSAVDAGKKENILDNPIYEENELTLNHKQNSFGFKYVALDFISSEKNNYAYKLEGFDDDWKYVHNVREATYTNLDPGEYKFMVKVSNNTKIWDAKPIVITILPPFWKTVWAYLFYAIFLLLILIFYRKYSIIEVNRKNKLIIDQLNYSKQEEINQAKLHFFTNLSHEIRTPLTLISSPVEELFNRTNDNIYQKEKLKIINQNVKRLLFLVNQLMDFRKIDSGYEKLNASYEDFSMLINEVIEAFKCYKSNKKAHIIFKQQESLYAWFDQKKMTTILYNLIGNAIKYNSESGKIEIEIKKINPTELSPKQLKWSLLKKWGKKFNDYIEFRISDQGEGIPKEELDKIFDRYYQADNPNKIIFNGTGIGLSLTKEYVELHKGKIWATSELGKGSCFVFKIPIGNDHLKPEEIITNNTINKEYIDELIACKPMQEISSFELNPNPQTTANGKEPLILLIEDDIELIDYLEKELVENYIVLKAKNGQEGLYLAQKYDPDIIITDIIMPEMDGLEMTCKLKSDLNTSHIPIIILSARDYDESKIESIEKGADAYISKPFKMDLLQAYIITILDSRKKLKEKYSQQLILEPADITINKIDETFIKKLIDIVERNIVNTEFNVHDLSNEMNISYRVLARKVKSLTNQTVNELIRTLRLKKAALILSKDKISIAEVSSLTGFNDPAYFSRCFQKQYGLPPTQYSGKPSKI